MMDTNLGDAGAPNDDASYTGNTGASAFDGSLQYYRNKVSEFQSVLTEVDRCAGIAQAAIDADISPELTYDLSAMLADYDARRWTFKVTAEAINAGAALVNGAGGRFPQLSIPTGLGAFPVFPAAAVAAVAAAATLIAWGVAWIAGVNARLQRAATLDAITDPAKRSEVAALALAADNARAAASGSPLSDIAGIVKWIAIGAGVWLLYKAANDSGLLKGPQSARSDDYED